MFWDFYELLFFPLFRQLLHFYSIIFLSFPKKRGLEAFPHITYPQKAKNMKDKAASTSFLGNCIYSIYELTLNIKLSLNI